MKTSISIIKRLARLGVLDTEPVKYKKEDDIIIKNSEGVEQKVIVDGVTDEDLPLLVAMEQLENIKYIKSVVKGYVIACAIALGIWLLAFLLELGSHM